MKRIAHSFGIMMIGFSWLAASAATAGDSSPYPVAGLAPDQRPAGAPAIMEFTRTDAWRAGALRGVTGPTPESILRFLGDQGAWYTPFARPGMPGPYDLRGLHAPQKAAP